MECRMTQMRYKEVINVSDGMRLGFIYDMVFSPETGRVTGLVIPGRSRAFGLLGREDDYVIPWESIKRIGDDIIIVDIKGSYRRERAPRREKVN